MRSTWPVRLQKLTRRSQKAHSVLAEIYAMKGAAADARVAFLRALQLDPNHLDSMMNLSILSRTWPLR